MTRPKTIRRGFPFNRIAMCGAMAVFALIPFSCGQNILHLVSPILLDDTHNVLDAVVAAVAPLVLP